MFEAKLEPVFRDPATSANSAPLSWSASKEPRPSTISETVEALVRRVSWFFARIWWYNQRRLETYRSIPLEKHSFTTLQQRLSRAGFKKDFVRSAVLPDWWDDSCAQQPDLLPEVEIRVSRFLGRPLSVVRDAGAALTPPSYSSAQLRRVRDIDRDRLAPAIHSALRIGEAVVRSLRSSVPRPVTPPPDGAVWRERVERARAAVTLDDILGDLWHRGIPVVPIDILPTPSFQGISCIVEDRPVILLGHKLDEPGRVAFLVAHETGHVANGDCALDQPVVDEDEEVADDSEIERVADLYATRVLVGSDVAPQVASANFRQLANSAVQIEGETGADASIIIFSWAWRTGDYVKASMAVKALYRAVGARQQLRQHFDRHVDLDAATESDRALLRCVYGEPERDAAAD